MSGWVLVLVVIANGALPATTMRSETFSSRMACEVALADVRRQINPAPHLQRHHTPPPAVSGGCYPR